MVQRRTTKTHSVQTAGKRARDARKTTTEPDAPSTGPTRNRAGPETSARRGAKPVSANVSRPPAAKTKGAAALAPSQTPTVPRQATATEASTTRAGLSKQARIIALLRRGEGATVAEMMAETGWLSHSVRGLLSGALKRKLGLAVNSRVEPDRGRVYRIGGESSSASATAATTAPEPERAVTRKRRAASATEARGEAP